MKIAAFSDTHTHHREIHVPEADIVIFAGDLMGSGYRHSEVKDFAKWFSLLPHRHKIIVAGNHDRLFQTDLEWCLEQFDDTVTYLEDSSTVVDSFKIYGSPVQPAFNSWSFNVPRGTAIKAYWDKIPTDTDILVTHGPPYDILDQSNGECGNDHLGCEELAKKVEIVKPRLHLFGHIHGSYGKECQKNSTGWTDFFNVAICDEGYRPVHPVTIIEINKGII